MKHWKVLLACVAAGCLILAVSISAFAQAGVPETGYRQFKDAVMNTVAAQNADIEADFTVTDNGRETAAGTSVWKFDGSMKLERTSIQCGGFTREWESGEKPVQEAEATSSSAMALAETLADTLAGDIKNEFAADAGHITLDLQGEEIPQITRLAVAAAAERLRQSLPGSETGMAAGLTGTDVQSLRMEADVSGGSLSLCSLDVMITGIDETGAAHTVGISVDARVGGSM